MTTLTEQEILDEISYTSDVIERIIGDKPQFFRPPYIDYNKKMYDMQGNVQTVEAIKTIIPELKKQGYEFVTIRDLFKKSEVVPERNTIYMEVK